MRQLGDGGRAEQAHCAIALFAALVAVGIASLGVLCRFGFSDNPPLEWAKFVGLSWFLVFFSLVVRAVLPATRGSGAGRLWTCHASLTLAALALVAVLGLQCGSTDRENVRSAAYLTVLFTIGGMGFALACLIAARSARLRDLLALVTVAALFSIYGAGASYGNGFQNQMFLESLCFNATNIDTLYHMSICNMLRTYGVSSTGLDGVPFMPYHFGSHWLFAQLCNLLNVSVADFYSRGYRVIFVPFSVFCVGTFAATLARRAGGGAGGSLPAPASTSEATSTACTEPVVKTRPAASPSATGPLFWLIVWAGYVSFMPYRPLATPLYAWSFVVVSESYNLAVSVSLLGFAWTLSLYQVLGARQNRWSPNVVVGAIVLAGLMATMNLLKISQVAILMATAAFFYVRLGWYRSSTFNVLLAAAAGGAYCVTGLTFDPNYAKMASQVRPLGFLRDSLEPELWPYFLLFYYAWLWIVAAVRFREERIRTVDDLVSALSSRRLLDIEFLFVIALAGAGPALIAVSFTGGQFFAEYHQWLAIGVLLSIVIRHLDLSAKALSASDLKGWSGFGRLTIGPLFFRAVLLAVTGMLLFNTYTMASWLVHNAAICRGHAGGGLGVTAALRHGRLEEAAAILRKTAADVELRIDTDKNVLQILRSLDKMPRSEKRRSLLYIPKSNRQYWELVHGSTWPFDNPLIAPALSGVAMIDGHRVPVAAGKVMYYGFSHYSQRDPAHRQLPPDQYLTILRRRCAEMGYNQLIVIDNAADGRSRQTKYSCP